VINCKKILVFQKGKIVEEGSHEELLAKNGVYTTVVKTQLTHQPDKSKKAKKVVTEQVAEVQDVEDVSDELMNDDM
jgi:ABC-type multidrug transport system ATPase subunit